MENEVKTTINSDGEKVYDPVDHSLGTLPIGVLLLRMSVPMMISMFIMACYNVVDSIFVAKISENALSALSLAYPVQFLMIALNIGTNVGVGTLISRSLGERNFKYANRYARHGILLALFYYIIFLLLGIFFTKLYFTHVTPNTEIQALGIEYLSIVMIFSIGSLFEATTARMMQSTGLSIWAMATQLTGAFFNIIFDPILIFGVGGIPAMGVKGAAIATVLGQILAGSTGLILNHIKNKSIKIEFFKLKFSFKIIKNIYKIGIPSIVMQSISSFMIFGLNMILIKYESAVAILGIYYKMQSFIFMPVLGLNNGMMPIVAYNLGAKRKDRIIKVTKIAITAAIIIMLFGTMLFELIPNIIFRLFSASDTMLEKGVYAFRIVALHFVIVGPNIILSTVMQACKKEMYSLIASVIRQIGALLPSAFILSKLFGYNGVWWCFLISETIAFIIILILYKKTYDTEISTLVYVAPKDTAR